jgi:hypothetical protein
MLGRLNTFVETKSQILSEFTDEGVVDQELVQAHTEGKDQMDIIDGEIILWSILSESRSKNVVKEDEV